MSLINPPAPGVYEDVSMDDYNSWDTVRSGHINAIVQGDPPAKVRHNSVHMGGSSDSQKLGTATHTKVFQPELFSKQVAHFDGDKRTKQGKADWKALEDSFTGDVILRGDQLDLCLGMYEAVMAHPAARALLEMPGKRELSAVAGVQYDDDVGGWDTTGPRDDSKPYVLLRGRADHLSLEKGGVIVDLKTTADASLRSFEKSIGNFGYDYQAAIYQKVYTALGLPTLHHAIIAVENTPPHLVAVYRITDPDMDDAAMEMTEPLLRLAECHKTNKWPGYPLVAQDVSRPAWKARMAEGLR